MPTVSFALPYLQRLTSLSPDQLVAQAFSYGLEASLLADTLTLEVTAERPDLLAAEGFCRAMNLYSGQLRSVPDPLLASGRRIQVSPTVLPLRPYIAALVVENIDLDAAALAALIQFQEKVTQTFGRQRQKIAIGLYDLDQIGGDVTYTTVPKTTQITPIDGQEPTTAAQLLNDHPNGKRYGQLFSTQDTVLALQDAAGAILSLPPVINASGAGRVSTATRSLLVDVTGISRQTVSAMINILAHNFLDTGSAVKTVLICHPEADWVTPTLERQAVTFSAKRLNAVLGTAIAKSDLGLQLKKMDLIVTGTDQVYVPTYRTDIFSEVDIAGDLMVSLGIDALPPEPILIKFHLGQRERLRDYVTSVSDLAQRLQLTEVKTFVLGNPERLGQFNFDKSPSAGILQTENAKSKSHSAVRSSLQPGLLEVLSRNIGAPKPLSLYEVGEAVRLQPDGSVYETLLWGFASLDARASFATAKAYMQTLLKALGIDFQLVECGDRRYIAGRAATVLVHQQPVGHFGEIHPALLAQFSFPEPVCSGEVDCQALLQSQPG